MNNIFCDWKHNRSNVKGRFILVGFRIASIAHRSKLAFFILLPHLIIYRFLVEWVLGCELPYKTAVGAGLVIYHGQALVINDGTRIGTNCIIRHCTTIGNKQLTDGTYSRCPIIGNNVDIGSNACIIGAITIGNNVKIGSGSVIVKDVPSNSIVVGNPGKVIKNIS